MSIASGTLPIRAPGFQAHCPESQAPASPMSKSHVQGPCPFQLGILRMPPPRQGWPYSAISNNSKTSSHGAPLHTSHFSAHALSLRSFTKPLGGFRFPSLRGEEAEGGRGKRESLRSPGRAALSPRSLSLSLSHSLSLSLSAMGSVCCVEVWSKEGSRGGSGQWSPWVRVGVADPW